MDIHGYLTLLCAVFGAMALIGYGMSLAGVTRAQRTVRVMGRIERVREPRHGSSQHDGIPVVVSFRDPSTGQEFTVTNDDEHGDRISTAWTGREIGVRYQQGRPHTYRFTHDLWANRHGRAWPNSAVFLLYAGLVVLVAIDWGWPWALLGFAGPWSVAAARYLPRNARATRRRIDALTSQPGVQGRVVAVLTDTSADEDGHTSTSHTPVIAFTTHEGTSVTAYCAHGLPDPVNSYGRTVTIHYSPEDPAVFTPDLTSEHSSRKFDMICSAVVIAVAVSAIAVGAVML